MRKYVVVMALLAAFAMSHLPSAFATGPSVVQSYTAEAANGSCPFALNVTSGNLLLVGTQTHASTTIQDSLNTQFREVSISYTNNAGQTVYASIYYGTATSTGADTITGGTASSTDCLEVHGAGSLGVAFATGTGTLIGSPSTIATSVLTPPTGAFVFDYTVGLACTHAPGWTSFPTSNYTALTTSSQALLNGQICDSSNAPGTIQWVSSYVSQYVASWGGTTTTAAFSGAQGDNKAGPGGWAKVAVYFPSVVTLTGKCSTTADTVTFSGGQVFPSTMACDNNTHTLTAAGNSIVSIITGTAPAGQAYMFKIGAPLVSQFAFNTGPAGGNVFFHEYLTDSIVVGYSGSAAQAPVLHYTAGGNATTLALTTSLQTINIDHGTAWTITKPAANFPNINTRYETNYANGTSASSQVISPIFYQQYRNTCSAAPSSGTWDSAYSIPVTSTLFGAAGTSVTISTVSGHPIDSAFCWADSGASVGYPTSFNDVTTGSWGISGQYNFQVTSGGNALAAVYALSTSTVTTTTTGIATGGGGGSAGIVSTSISTVQGGPPQVGSTSNQALGIQILAAVVLGLVAFGYISQNRNAKRRFEKTLTGSPARPKQPKRRRPD